MGNIKNRRVLQELKCAKGILNKQKNPTLLRSYSNFALNKAGDVLAGIKNSQGPHDVLLQPVPVLDDFLLGDT